MKTIVHRIFGPTSALTVAVSMLLFGCEQVQPGLGITGSDALTADQVVPTGQACTPTGKHYEHRTYACAACHQCAGTVSFDPAVAGSNAAFDAVTKNCSSVACHAVPSGYFTYTTWDWGNDVPVDVTVPYGGPPPAPAYWYATGAANCTVCHDYPPKYQGTRYAWHSGAHANTTTPGGNACELCHSDATGAFVFGGPPSFAGSSGGRISACAPGTFCAAPGVITNASLHGNGALNVTPRWSSWCNGCH